MAASFAEGVLHPIPDHCVVGDTPELLHFLAVLPDYHTPGGDTVDTRTRRLILASAGGDPARSPYGCADGLYGPQFVWV